jgi:hypothetical protein
VFTSPTRDTATEDLPFVYVASAICRDSGLVPVFTFGTHPAWLSLSHDTVRGTPREGARDTIVTLLATAAGATDTLKLRLTVVPVNDPPIIVSAGRDTAAEDIRFIYRVAAKDTDNAVLTYSFIRKPTWLTAAGDSIFGTPAEGRRDTSFTVIVSDGSLADTQGVVLVVRAVNDPPIITSASRDTAVEDIRFVYRAAAKDTDNTVLTYNFIRRPAWLTAAGDSIYGTPTEGRRDTSFTVIVSDGSLADTQVVVLMVRAVNDPPVITSAARDTAVQGSYFCYRAAATDPDNVPTFVFRNLPGWLSAQGDSVYGTAPDSARDTLFRVIASDSLLADTQIVVLIVRPKVGMVNAMLWAADNPGLNFHCSPQPADAGQTPQLLFTWNGRPAHYELTVFSVTGEIVWYADGRMETTGDIRITGAALAPGNYTAGLIVREQVTGYTVRATCRMIMAH